MIKTVDFSDIIVGKKIIKWKLLVNGILKLAFCTMFPTVLILLSLTQYGPMLRYMTSEAGLSDALQVLYGDHLHYRYLSQGLGVLI